MPLCDPGLRPPRLLPLPTRWSSRVSLPRKSAGYVTKFAPHLTLKLIASGKFTFDERVELHRVGGEFHTLKRIEELRAPHFQKVRCLYISASRGGPFPHSEEAEVSFATPRLAYLAFGSLLASEEGITYRILKTFALKMSQDKARIWPRLTYLVHGRSKATLFFARPASSTCREGLGLGKWDLGSRVED